MGTYFEKLEVNGVEDLVECTRDADIEVSQTRSGVVEGELTQIDLDGGVISTGKFRGSIRVRGVMATEGVVLGTLMEADGPTFEWGKEVQTGYVGHYLGGHECDSIHNESLSYTLLTIPRQLLELEAAQREMNLPSDFWTTPIFSMTRSDHWRVLHTYLRTVRSTMENPAIHSNSTVRTAVLEESMELFLRTIKTAMKQDAGGSNLGANHYETVRRAEDYLSANSEAPVRLCELSQNIGVSQTGLNRAFRNVLDVSPITYLRRWRLSQVRRCITEEAETGISVTEAALRFGFWELGRFSGQYSELFGELPSATLKNNGGLEAGK